MARPRHERPKASPLREPEAYNVALLREGDPQEREREWARVVGDLTGPLQACLRVRGFSDRLEDVEDIVQDTLLRAVRYIGTFDPEEGTLRQWIFGIMDNERKRVLRDLATKPTHGEAGLVNVASPGNPARRLETRIDLEAAEARLPPKQRQAWELHERLGMTFPEAEAATGQDHGALKVASHRAKRRLRELLD